MQDDEQSIIEVTPHLRLFERYWGWEIRYDGVLVGSILRLDHPLLNYVVTSQTTRGGVVIDALRSFKQAIEYVRVNEGYLTP